MRNSLFLWAIFLTAQLASAEVNFISSETMVDLLDSPCTAYNNPLKGIVGFTVLISEKPSDTELFIEELEKIGRVKKFSFSDPKGIDFEGMGTGARLLFLSIPLANSDESKCPIKRVTLCLSMNVEILNTKNRVESYVWATNQFVAEDKISEAIKNEIRQFAAYYKTANPDTTPIFYVYQ